jgi:hypothetical protein
MIPPLDGNQGNLQSSNNIKKTEKYNRENTPYAVRDFHHGHLRVAIPLSGTN